ncbi:hypothetical protein CR513_08965, partial [Mucuna pruriens]
MNKFEIVKEFANSLSNVVTQIKFLGEELSNQRVVPLNKEKKSLRVLENIEGVFEVNTKGKTQDDNSSKKNSLIVKEKVGKTSIHYVLVVTRKIIQKIYICFFGHLKKFCKSKTKQQGHQAQVVEEQNKKHLFVDSYYLKSNSKEAWVIDSGCTNYMTNSYFSKVTIGNEGNVEVKDKGVFVEISLGSKYISHVLFVFEINQNKTFHRLIRSHRSSTFASDFDIANSKSDITNFGFDLSMPNPNFVVSISQFSVDNMTHNNNILKGLTTHDIM